MNTNPKFERGDVVHADDTYVLVTGKGDARAFESFAGVCIATANKNHTVGEYSRTWNRILFEDAPIDPQTMVSVPSVEDKNMILTLIAYFSVEDEGEIAQPAIEWLYGLLKRLASANANDRTDTPIGDDAQLQQ